MRLSFGNYIEKSLVIAVFVKDGKPTVASIEDMIDETAGRVSQWPAHENKLLDEVVIPIKKGPDTFSSSFSVRAARTAPTIPKTAMSP